MRILGVGKIRRVGRLVLSAVQDWAVILLYHRVAALCPDPQLLCVTPAHIAEHLQVIRQHYHPISLRDLRRGVLSRQLPRHAVVVTFDDGYADNLWHAAPLLEQYGIPAAIFVTSGYVGEQREMVSDELERILLQTETLPPSLTLKIGTEARQWFLGNSPAQRMPWDVTSGVYPSPRHRCYYELHRLLRPMNVRQRQEVLSQLARWVGCTEEGRPERRMMNAIELQTISRSGLIEIGAHAVWHVMLAQHPVEMQRCEIEGCKQQLEQVLGRPVTSFAYPYGGAEAVSLQTKRCVQQAGFELACDNVPGTVGPQADLFALPRCLVRDWDGDEFHQRLRDAFLN